MDPAPTPWTAEQAAILDHPDDAHALVRAVPGAGKTTTLVGRVDRLRRRGVDLGRVRVVMFNRSIAETFRARLAALGIAGVRVSTFDSLGLEVLRAAERAGLLQRPLRVVPGGAEMWAREVARRRDPALDPEALADAIAFWKAHLITPARAAFPGRDDLVDAYRECEALRLDGGLLRVAYADMVYTAVRALKERPGLLGAIDHLLVDEFQDVNLARVTLLQRLIHRRTVIMAVGDEDQAINEWCGAHPRFFREFAALFPDRPSREYALSRSFRLGPTLAAAASRLIAHNHQDTPAGAHIDGAGRHAGAIVDVNEVAPTVAELLAAGASPGDIAVLTRSRGQGVAAIAGLVAAGVPIDADDFEGIRRSRAAALILGYLRFATSDQRPTFADAWRIVFAPERYVNKALFARQLAARGDWGLTATLADRELARQLGQPPSAVLAMGELAGALQRIGRCAGVGEALARLRDHVDLAAQLAAPHRGERSSAAADEAAIDAVIALLAGLGGPPATAAAALAAVDPTRGAAPDQRVWVSTIHRAKGREWPHVILPALADGLCPAEGGGPVPGSQDGDAAAPPSEWLAQERRIFYVAVTRASERVYVQALAPTPSRFLAELRGAAPPIRRRPAAAAPAAPAPKKEKEKRDPDATSSARGDAPATAGPWSRADRQALRVAWARGATVDAIAGELGRSVGAVARRLLRLGLADDEDEIAARRAST